MPDDFDFSDGFDFTNPIHIALLHDTHDQMEKDSGWPSTDWGKIARDDDSDFSDGFDLANPIHTVLPRNARDQMEKNPGKPKQGIPQILVNGVKAPETGKSQEFEDNPGVAPEKAAPVVPGRRRIPEGMTKAMAERVADYSLRDARAMARMPLESHRVLTINKCYHVLWLAARQWYAISTNDDDAPWFRSKEYTLRFFIDAIKEGISEAEKKKYDGFIDEMDELDCCQGHFSYGPEGRSAEHEKFLASIDKQRTENTIKMTKEVLVWLSTTVRDYFSETIP
jgi:hypothetical protein